MSAAGGGQLPCSPDQPHHDDVSGPQTAEQPPRGTAVDDVQTAEQRGDQGRRLERDDRARRQRTAPRVTQKQTTPRDGGAGVQPKAALTNRQRNAVNDEAALLSADVRTQVSQALNKPGIQVPAPSRKLKSC